MNKKEKWWHPDEKYQYDIEKKVKAEGCRKLKREYIECKNKKDVENKVDCEYTLKEYK